MAKDYAVQLIAMQIIKPDEQARAVRLFETYPKFFEITKQGKFDLVKAEKFLNLEQDVQRKPHTWSSELQVSNSKLSIAAIRSYGSEDDAISAISSVLIDFAAAAFNVQLNILQVRLMATRINQDYYFL